MSLTRRQFLALGAGAVAAWPFRRALAIGDGDKFQIALLAHGGNWNPRPTALRRLLWEIDKRTSIDVKFEPAEVRIAQRELFRYPFLWLSSDRAMPAFTDEEIGRLRRHLQAGGFLFVDSADPRQERGPGASPFDQSVRTLASRLFPREPLGKLPEDHVLYKSFYLLRQPVGRIAATPWLEAVQHDGRAAMVYSQNDLLGAFARDDFGQWEHEAYPGGEQQREMAFRLGINLALYATCLDYKTDQVHVPFILRRRRWNAGP
jgi:hypothetical protein